MSVVVPNRVVAQPTQGLDDEERSLPLISTTPLPRVYRLAPNQDQSKAGFGDTHIGRCRKPGEIRIFVEGQD